MRTQRSTATRGERWLGYRVRSGVLTYGEHPRAEVRGEIVGEMTKLAGQGQIRFVGQFETVDQQNVDAGEQVRGVRDAQGEKEHAGTDASKRLAAEGQNLTSIADESNAHDYQIAVEKDMFGDGQIVEIGRRQRRATDVGTHCAMQA